MRVTQLAGERRLLEKLRAVHRAEFRIAEHLGLDRLQGHLPAREGIARQVHRAGGALAEQLLDVVLADLEAEALIEVEVELECRFLRHGLPPCRRQEFITILFGCCPEE